MTKSDIESIDTQFHQLGLIVEKIINDLEKKSEDVITKDDAQVIVKELIPEIDRIISLKVKQHFLALLNLGKIYESQLLEELRDAKVIE